MVFFESDSDYSDDALGISVRANPERARRHWLETNFEVLQELYRAFLESGRGVFTDAFYQRGGFHTFAMHIYEFTQPGRVSYD